MMTERTLTKAEIEANVQKTIAETENTLAAAANNAAQAEWYKAQASLKKHEVNIAKIQQAKIAREETFALATDLLHRVYTFDQEVTGRSVKACIHTLSAWSRTSPDCEITIYLNSPGGDIVAGFALIDFIVDLRNRGHHIKTVALGMAASMSAVILQAGTERVMGSNAVLLIHEGSLGTDGSFGEVQDQMVLIGKLHTNIYQLFEDRA